MSDVVEMLLDTLTTTMLAIFSAIFSLFGLGARNGAESMRVIGGTLVACGILWLVACFLGTAMMPRDVDWFTEAAVPGALGLLVSLPGIWLWLRSKPEETDTKPS